MGETSILEARCRWRLPKVKSFISACHYAGGQLGLEDAAAFQAEPLTFLSVRQQ
jgi:hypothetical protein